MTTTRIWREKRRPELLKAFEQEIYGRTPIARPTALKFVIRDEKRDVFNGKATRLRVRILDDWQVMIDHADKHLK